MSLRGVYQILRVPLFITAVVDVVAGYTVGLLPQLENFDWRLAALLAGTSAGLYLFGMVENDLRDIRRDRLLNPQRPLVTGEITVGGAVVLLLLAAGLAAACASTMRGGRGGALTLAILTFAIINLYNLGAKYGPPPVAMIVMGLCRMLNFGIGVAAAAGLPRELRLDLLALSGPLWVRQGLALFFVTLVITGYSICARRGVRISTRPWRAAFVVTALAGFAMLAASVWAESSEKPFVAPVARVFAGLLLASLWPGGLWSATGPRRSPEEYAPFIERAIYWMIVMNVAFVLDGMLAR
jgi:4-hydroxybenzoate polyprenyltransferase